MDKEELRLLRENNEMLKRILFLLESKSHGQYAREFIINVLANKVADMP